MFEFCKTKHPRYMIDPFIVGEFKYTRQLRWSGTRVSRSEHERPFIEIARSCKGRTLEEQSVSRPSSTGRSNCHLSEVFPITMWANIWGGVHHAILPSEGLNGEVPVTMVDVPILSPLGRRIVKWLGSISEVKVLKHHLGICSPCLRKMPVVLPEHLFPWLLKFQHLPSSEDISQYWNHMAQLKNIPWVNRIVETGGMYVPVYLWGDDAVYNERNEKLVSVVCGSWLDDRKNSKDTVYPLFTYRYDAWQKLKTTIVFPVTCSLLHKSHPRNYPWGPKRFKLFWSQCLGKKWCWWTRGPGVDNTCTKVVESFNRLFDGIPIGGHAGQRTNNVLRCLVTDFLGDWKWHKDPWLQTSDQLYTDKSIAFS